MFSEEERKEILKMLEERKKWKYFIEVISRKYIFFPLLIVIIALIDNPDVYIIKSLVSSIKKYLGF